MAADTFQTRYSPEFVEGFMRRACYKATTDQYVYGEHHTQRRDHTDDAATGTDAGSSNQHGTVGVLVQEEAACRGCVS